MEIKTQLIPVGHPNRKGIKIIPKAVVIHYTANDAPTSTDTNNVKYAGRAYKRINNIDYEADGKTSFRKGSAQWYIDMDSATLAIPTNECAWGCGDRQLPYNNGCKGETPIARDVFGYKQNYMTINYEICNNDAIKNSEEDWNRACANAIEIIAKDMITYNIPMTMVFMHGQITGKNCPKPFMQNSKAWEQFKQALANKINVLKNPVSTTTPQTSPYKMTKPLVVLTPLANCYIEPSLSSKLVKQFKLNDHLTAVDETALWYKLTIGWIQKSNFVVQSPTQPIQNKIKYTELIVVANKLNCRAGAGTQYPVLKQFKLNDKLTAIGEIINGFYRLNLGGRDAFISAQYCKSVNVFYK